MLNNSHFLSKVANERVETALKEAEMIRLAKLAAQDRPSFWRSGRKRLLTVCSVVDWGRFSTRTGGDLGAEIGNLPDVGPD